MLYIEHMFRTQVYLKEAQARALALLAQVEKKPQAVMVREAVDEYLARKKTTNADGGLLGLAKLAESLGAKHTDPYASRNIDKYLYEDL